MPESVEQPAPVRAAACRLPRRSINVAVVTSDTPRCSRNVAPPRRNAAFRARNVHFRAGNVHFRAGHVHFRAGNVHFRARNVHFRARNVHFRARNVHFHAGHVDRSRGNALRSPRNPLRYDFFATVEYKDSIGRGFDSWIANDSASLGNVPPRTSPTYAVTASLIVAPSVANRRTNRGLNDSYMPSMSYETSTWPSHATPAPIPIVGTSTVAVISRAMSDGMASSTIAYAPASASARASASRRSRPPASRPCTLKPPS